MKNTLMISSIGILCLFSTSRMAYADGLFDSDHYNQCILENLKNVKLDTVAREFSRICSESFADRWTPSKGHRQYNEYLMDYLEDVESEFAAAEIIKACRKQYPD